MDSPVAVHGLSCSVACGSLVPWPGPEPCIGKWILSTGPPEKSLPLDNIYSLFKSSTKSHSLRKAFPSPLRLGHHHFILPSHAALGQCSCHLSTTIMMYLWLLENNHPYSLAVDIVNELIIDLIIIFRQQYYTIKIMCVIIFKLMDSLTGKESTCNAGNPSSTPGLGRSAGEGIGFPFQYSWNPWWFSW